MERHDGNSWRIEIEQSYVWENFWYVQAISQSIAHIDTASYSPKRYLLIIGGSLFFRPAPYFTSYASTRPLSASAAGVYSRILWVMIAFLASIVRYQVPLSASTLIEHELLFSYYRHQEFDSIQSTWQYSLHRRSFHFSLLGTMSARGVCSPSRPSCPSGLGCNLCFLRSTALWRLQYRCHLHCWCLGCQSSCAVCRPLIPSLPRADCLAVEISVFWLGPRSID